MAFPRMAAVSCDCSSILEKRLRRPSRTTIQYLKPAMTFCDDHANPRDSWCFKLTGKLQLNLIYSLVGFIQTGSFCC
jgi:hypothetical protein